MQVDIKIPSVGESISQVEIGEWLKNTGEAVRKNENLLLLETDKATVEINAPENGTLIEVLKRAGESAAVGEVIARIETAESGKPTSAPKPSKTPKTSRVRPETAAITAHEENRDGQPVAESERPVDPSLAAEPQPERFQAEEKQQEREVEIIGAKESAAQELQDAKPAQERAQPAAMARDPEEPTPGAAGERDEIVPMSALRRRIAERLVAAQQQAALLTTFNEIDMAAISALRRSEGEQFYNKHKVKLGLMSFFVKAAVAALHAVREINAEIRGERIVYHNYYDIGIAVGGGRGLVVPVLRDCDRLSFAEMERRIADFAQRARENGLRPDELQGGTFTITNGGVYGSLFSTPIVNPPQSAILGLHAIQDRPIAKNGQVLVQPMMYAALTYDHRIVDGREAVLFLKHIKTLIEEPVRLLLES
jgi:2-oxoglutarate dehydrogenase E2 component (dihydrolipoamide succinyltransferase)